MKSVHLLFLLLPILTFAQETPPTKPITWEKEGQQTFHYLNQKMDLLQDVKGKKLLGFCSLIYVLSHHDYKEIIDHASKLSQLDKEHSPAYVRATFLGILMNRYFVSHESADHTPFVSQCVKEIS